MEAEERPSKLRKLQHHAPDDRQMLAENVVMDKESRSHLAVDAHEEETIDLKSAAADTTETNEPDAERWGSSIYEGCEEPGMLADQSTLPLSKNALKKIRNKEKWDAGRDARKVKRKQKVAEKRVRKRAAREEARTAAAAAKAVEDEANRKEKPKGPIFRRLPITFVIDCGFDKLMTEREMISLGSQLTRSYSDNHKAQFQAHLFVSSWGGMLKERFDTVLEKHHKNWRDVTFMEEDFVEAAQRAKELMRGKKGGKLAGAFAAESNDKTDVADASDTVAGTTAEGDAKQENDAEVENLEATVMTPEGAEHLAYENCTPAADEHSGKLKNGIASEPAHSMNRREETPVEAAAADEAAQPSEEEARQEGEILYLTSDSPHTLDRLQPYSTYIVGGLVDKNRHKGICYKTACDRGIKTAKLPIGEFMEMQSRFVLATNHVIEIMVRWLECGDWGESFVKVMPKRKGGVLKAACGIGQDLHGNELEVDGTTSSRGDLGEANADAHSYDHA